MEYLDSRHKKIDNETKVDLEKLSSDLSASQNVRDMTSFKLYQKSKEKKEVEPVKKSKLQLGGVSLTDRMMFMDNMSTMLKAGLSLTPALATLQNEIKNKYFQDIVGYLKDHVENGQPLSSGMKHYPKVFSDMIIATIEVGENTGMLSDSFGHLAAILKAQKKLRSKVIGALMYPAIVILAMLAVSLFLALFIFPQLVDLFVTAGVELPFVLKAVQFISHSLTNYGWYILGVLIALGFVTKFVFRIPKARLARDAFVLKIPFVGKIVQELSLTRFTGNLNALLAAGLSIVKSMEISAKTLGNLRYSSEIIYMSKELEKGVSLEKSMAQRPDLFPSLTIQLIKVGETTGQLEDILKKISVYYEERVDNILSNLSTIIEPALLLVVGVMVGFIAVSVIGPMYELTNSFGN